MRIVIGWDSQKFSFILRDEHRFFKAIVERCHLHLWVFVVHWLQEQIDLRIQTKDFQFCSSLSGPGGTFILKDSFSANDWKKEEFHLTNRKSWKIFTRIFSSSNEDRIFPIILRHRIRLFCSKIKYESFYNRCR